MDWIGPFICLIKWFIFLIFFRHLILMFLMVWLFLILVSHLRLWRDPSVLSFHDILYKGHKHFFPGVLGLLIRCIKWPVKCTKCWFVITERAWLLLQTLQYVKVVNLLNACIIPKSVESHSELWKVLQHWTLFSPEFIITIIIIIVYKLHVTL